MIRAECLKGVWNVKRSVGYTKKESRDEWNAFAVVWCLLWLNLERSKLMLKGKFHQSCLIKGCIQNKQE